MRPSDYLAPAKMTAAELVEYHPGRAGVHGVVPKAPDAYNLNQMRERHQPVP